jgi:hypothetical protein
MSTAADFGVMYESVCKSVWEEGMGKMAFTFGREETIRRRLRERPKSFLDWEKTEGVLTPELCDQHEHKEGTPMLLDGAPSRSHLCG